MVLVVLGAVLKVLEVVLVVLGVVLVVLGGCFNKVLLLWLASSNFKSGALQEFQRSFAGASKEPCGSSSGPGGGLGFLEVPDSR